MNPIDEWQTPLHAGHLFVGLYVVLWCIACAFVTGMVLASNL